MFKVGIATSARHVVGLHEPPKNTSGALSSPKLQWFLSSRNRSCDIDTRDLHAVADVTGIIVEQSERKRFKSAASTQNSPKVMPFNCRWSLRFEHRRAQFLTVFNMSITANSQKQKLISIRPRQKVQNKNQNSPWRSVKCKFKCSNKSWMRSAGTISLRAFNRHTSSASLQWKTKWRKDD